MKHSTFFLTTLVLVAGIAVFTPLYYFQHTIDTVYLGAWLFVTVAFFLIELIRSERSKPVLEISLQPRETYADTAAQHVRVIARHGSIPVLKAFMTLGPDGRESPMSMFETPKSLRPDAMKGETIEEGPFGQFASYSQNLVSQISLIENEPHLLTIWMGKKTDEGAKVYLSLGGGIGKTSLPLTGERSPDKYIRIGIRFVGIGLKEQQSVRYRLDMESWEKIGLAKLDDKR